MCTVILSKKNRIYAKKEESHNEHFVFIFIPFGVSINKFRLIISRGQIGRLFTFVLFDSRFSLDQRNIGGLERKGTRESSVGTSFFLDGLRHVKISESYGSRALVHCVRCQIRFCKIFNSRYFLAC